MVGYGSNSGIRQLSPRSRSVTVSQVSCHLSSCLPTPVPFREFTQLSPNRDLTPPNEQLGVVFHHSVIPFDETIALMMRPESKASYHVLIALDGTRCTLVRDEQVPGTRAPRPFLAAPGATISRSAPLSPAANNLAPLTDAQIASALEWLEPRWTQRGWTIACVTDHRQVSLATKDDLNPAEWARGCCLRSPGNSARHDPGNAERKDRESNFAHPLFRASTGSDAPGSSSISSLHTIRG